MALRGRRSTLFQATAIGIFIMLCTKTYQNASKSSAAATVFGCDVKDNLSEKRKDNGQTKDIKTLTPPKVRVRYHDNRHFRLPSQIHVRMKSIRKRDKKERRKVTRTKLARMLITQALTRRMLRQNAEQLLGSRIVCKDACIC